MPKLKTNKAAKKDIHIQQQEKLKEQNLIEDTYQLEKLLELNQEEKYKMLMQIRHAKQESRNYYHMVINH